MMIANSQPLPERDALFFRLAVGFFIGVIVAYLTQEGTYEASQSKEYLWRESWAQTLTLSAFILWADAAVMRRVSLAIWTLVASALTLYIIWHMKSFSGDQDMGELTSNLILLALAFIANELVSSADQARKPFARYELYFDEAWKRGVQLILAIGFTLLFWGILWLGAALLGFIGFDWLTQLLRDEYFAMPITGLAFASAVHLGDIQPKLLANVRGLALGVLAWLLPVITLIGAIFAVSLVFSGLQPLWDTKAATATLLSACIGFVLLINAAFQQGETDRKVQVVLKWCVRLAALLLLVFAVLAAWSLGLRINQYGLTIDRTLAGMVVVIALAYGLGYSAAVFWRGSWMELVKPLNIGLAVFKCLVFIAILTPIASPARLSVDNQVKRLASGAVKPDQFDWWLLRDRTGTYGKKALDLLAKSPDKVTAQWATRAKLNALGARPPRDESNETAEQNARPNLKEILVVSPLSASLPESFINQDFTQPGMMNAIDCLWRKLRENEPKCRAALLDLNGDNRPEILFLEDSDLVVFQETSKGWLVAGTKTIMRVGASEDFDARKLQAVQPAYKDLFIGEERIQIEWNNNPELAEPAAQAPSKP